MPILSSLATRGFGIAAGSAAVPYLGPYGAYDALAHTEVGAGGVSSVEFSGIPTGYKHLQLRASMMCSAINNMYLQVGAGTLDTTGNYSWHQLFADDGTLASNGNPGATFAYIGYNYNTSYPNASIIDIYDYADPSKFTTFRTVAGTEQNARSYIQLWGGSWRQTLPVNVLRITPGSGTFTQYGVFSLYGIR